MRIIIFFLLIKHTAKGQPELCEGSRAEGRMLKAFVSRCVKEVKIFGIEPTLLF